MLGEGDVRGLRSGTAVGSGGAEGCVSLESGRAEGGAPRRAANGGAPRRKVRPLPAAGGERGIQRCLSRRAPSCSRHVATLVPKFLSRRGRRAGRPCWPGGGARRARPGCVPCPRDNCHCFALAFCTLFPTHVTGERSTTLLPARTPSVKREGARGCTPPRRSCNRRGGVGTRAPSCDRGRAELSSKAAVHRPVPDRCRHRPHWEGSRRRHLARTLARGALPARRAAERGVVSAPADRLARCIAQRAVPPTSQRQCSRLWVAPTNPVTESPGAAGDMPRVRAQAGRRRATTGASPRSPGCVTSAAGAEREGKATQGRAAERRNQAQLGGHDGRGALSPRRVARSGAPAASDGGAAGRRAEFAFQTPVPLAAGARSPSTPIKRDGGVKRIGHAARPGGGGDAGGGRSRRRRRQPRSSR
jgi:hypothetical protein